MDDEARFWEWDGDAVLRLIYLWFHKPEGGRVSVVVDLTPEEARLLAADLVERAARMEAETGIGPPG